MFYQLVFRIADQVVYEFCIFESFFAGRKAALVNNFVSKASPFLEYGQLFSSEARLPKIDEVQEQKRSKLPFALTTKQLPALLVRTTFHSYYMREYLDRKFIESLQ